MFRTRLKELREANGYRSQQAFADAFGVAQSTVGNWEAGTREPNHETTIRIAAFFNAPVGYLLGSESQDEYSARFCHGLSEALESLDYDMEPEAVSEFRKLKDLSESVYPVSLADACTAANKVGATLDELIWGKSNDLSVKKSSPDSEAGLDMTIVNLILSLPEEKKAEAVNYIRYLAENIGKESEGDKA